MLNNLGALYDDLGKKTEALEYYEQALTIAQDVGGRAGEGITLNNLGLLYNDIKKRKEALEYFQQALAIRQEVGDRAGEGVTLSNMGTLFLDQKHYATALAALLLAQRLFQQVQSPDLEAVESWIIELALRAGEEKFRELVSQVSLQPEKILKQAYLNGKSKIRTDPL